MKAFCSLICGLILFAQGFSQIVIDQNDMPKEGDTLRMSIANVLSADYTKTGIDTTWDFSLLRKTGQTVDTFLNVLNVPAVYWIVFTPVLVCNLASPATSPIPVPGIVISDLFTFYKKSSTAFNNLGLAFQISAIPVMVKYDNPDILYSLPCEMGKTWNSIAASSASLPGLGYYSTKRNRTSHVDGWGHLITPFGNYQTIRVKSQYVENDSIYLDTLNQGFPITRNVTEYKWLAKNQGEPLLTITEEGSSVSIFYRDILNHEGINEKNNGNVSVSPNPSEGSFAIRAHQLNSSVQIKIINMIGTTVIEDVIHMKSGASEILNYPSLKDGLYLIKVIDKMNTYTGKLLIKK